MSIRKKWQQFREEWEASKPPEKPSRNAGKGTSSGKAGQGCAQRWCGKPVWRDGFCQGCWMAVYGGVI